MSRAASVPPYRPRRPQGQATRGKTAQNRLRRVDRFLQWYAPAVIQRNDGPWARALFVDLGYGAEPFTTLESAARLRKLNPDLRLLGVEIDPERVAAACPMPTRRPIFGAGASICPWGSNLDGQPEVVRCIRAFNVLRQYEEAEVAGAYAAMAHGVLPGGLLVEGTSDPYGRLWVANILRCTEAGDWQPEALVFSTNFRAGFEPALFQPVLPKNYIHRMVPGEPIAAFIDAWKRTAQRTLAVRVWGLRPWFRASVLALAEEGWPVERRKLWLDRGFLILRQPFSGP